MKFLIILLGLVAVIEGAPNLNDIKIIYFGNSVSDNVSYIQTNSSNSSSLSTTYFDPAKKTVVMTCGWNINPTDECPQALINAYLKRKDEWNVLYLDWSTFSKCLLVTDIVSRVNSVANTTTKILQANSNFKAANTHMIGSGLGAVVLGTTAKNLKEVMRFTSLDSGEFFNLLQILFKTFKVSKVDASTAKFVDTIHTNDNALGDFNVRGHVNFFVNGGSKQPGCNTTLRNIFNSFVSRTTFEIVTCNTQRACKYYAESINGVSSSPPFISKQCDSKVTTFSATTCSTTSKASMGYYADVTTTNRDAKNPVNYHTETNASPPYSKN